MNLSQRIRADIEKAILSGRWAPGYRLPIEAELMVKYRCARMTVNRAMPELVESGLIVRRKRAGSFVATPRVHAAVLSIPDIQTDVEARGKVYGYRMLSRGIRAPELSSPEERELAGAGRLLEIRALHTADGSPFALENRLISLDAVPESLDADFETVAPGTWLVTYVPWTEAEHRISAINADPRIARLLDLAAGDACLVLERRTWRAREHVTRVRQTFPSDLFDLTARFTPKLLSLTS